MSRGGRVAHPSSKGPNVTVRSEVQPAPPLSSAHGPSIPESDGESATVASGDPGDRAKPLRLEFTRCCLCNRSDADPVAVGADFEYRSSPDQFLAARCRECGLIYLEHRPAMSELDRIYPPDYHAFDFSPERYGFSHRVRQWLEARRLLACCRTLPPDARIVDVGCGDGFHLELLRSFGSSGWRLEGVDASERAVNAGRARGFVMHHGTAQEVSLAPESFDLALLIATIEHVDDPPAVLKAVHRWLRPGGRVLVVTDNTDTLSFRLSAGRHWGGYHFPRHWNLFDKRSLGMLASHAGFEVESLTTILSPVNWTYTVHNALVDWGAPAWLVNRFTLASPGSLAVFTLVDSLQKLRDRGGLLRAVLRKPATEDS
jgi:SAM-dependent methyltransferase